MKMSIFKMPLQLIIVIMAMMFSISASAAVTWTVQPEKYYTYNTTPTAAKESLKRVKTTDTKTVIKPGWVKIGDLWIKKISSGGAVDYDPYIPDVPTTPVDDTCEGKFVCDKDWGWIVVITKNQVLECTAIKITKEKAAFFEGAQVTDSEGRCSQ